MLLAIGYKYASETISSFCCDRESYIYFFYTFSQIIDEKSLIKKYQKEISVLKQELDQVKRGILPGITQEEIMSLRQQVLIQMLLNLVVPQFSTILYIYLCSISNFLSHFDLIYYNLLILWFII